MIGLNAMNTTPIEAGMGALTGGTIALCLFVLLILVAACVFIWKKLDNDFKIPTLISVIVVGLAGIITIGAVMVEHEESKRSDEIKTYISSLGFEFTSGDIAVYTGTDKEFTVSKNDEEVACTSYAPDSVNDNIFLVCDDALSIGKGSIEDLSIQLDGIKTREDALSSSQTPVSQ